MVRLHLSTRLITPGLVGPDNHPRRHLDLFRAVAGHAVAAAGPAAVIEQDNVTSALQFGNEARRDRMTAVAVIEVGEGHETSD